MDGGLFTIRMHHGGAFSENGILTYVGGQVSFFRNNDTDRMSYFEIVDMARNVGFNDGDKLYYTIPGYSLDVGIDQVYDDQSMLRMLKYVKSDIFLDIYIQHINEHGISGHTRSDTTIQDINLDEPWLVYQQTSNFSILRRHRMKILLILYVHMVMLMILIRRRRRRIVREPSWYDPNIREKHLHNMIGRSDTFCIEQLRMDRRCFGILCYLVRQIGGLRDTRNMSVEEMVAIFLHIVAYDEKNREAKFDFQRSQETISRHFHDVLRAILKLWQVLLKSPQPINDDCADERWKWFKNCLGALDGTYIKVNVPSVDKPRYRSRKNDIATNVLGICTPDMQFIYVLPGWEGSAADGRILRDALSRPNGIKVPRGCYYLVDAGYKNCEGFLAPYRGQRYHLQEWRNPPTKKEELFNMKHSSARNVIERTFGLLKIRWGILRNPSYYPIDTHIEIILACCYLHNLIRQQMSFDPYEHQLDDFIEQQESNEDVIDSTEPSQQWTQWRDKLAQDMWDDWRSKRRTE